MAGVNEARPGIAEQVRIGFVLLQDAFHACEHMRVDVSRDIAEVGGNAAFDLRAVDEMALPVHLLDEPAVPRDRDALAGWRRVHDGAELGALRAHGELLVLLEDRVELE